VWPGRELRPAGRSLLGAGNIRSIGSLQRSFVTHKSFRGYIHHFPAIQPFLDNLFRHFVCSWDYIINPTPAFTLRTDEPQPVLRKLAIQLPGLFRRISIYRIALTKFIPKHAQEAFTPGYILFPFNTLGAETIYYSDDAAPQLSFSNKDFDWIG